MKKLSVPIASMFFALCGTPLALGQANDVCLGATPISGESTFAYDNTGANTNGPTVPCLQPPAAIEGDLWYSWTASFTGSARVSTCDLGDLDTMLAVYDACPPSTLLACNDDSCAFQSEVTFAAREGEAYQIRIGTYPGSAHGAGAFSVEETTFNVTPCDSPGGPDVVVARLTDIIHWGTAGPINGYSIGATACNVGDTTMPWAGLTNHHPLIAQHIMRVADGAIEQIGMSWLKHGFASATEDFCCACQSPDDSQVMGIGCADTYSAGINGSQTGSNGTGGLGPRTFVNPWSGAFPFPYGDQGVSGDSAYKRLQVHNDDLDPAFNPDAQYIGEVQYITPDEGSGNRNNGVSHRELGVLGPALGGWSLGFIDTSVRERPAIYAWQARYGDVRIEAVDVPNDGRIYVASRVTDNGDGTWRYRYAVQNVNSHRSVRALGIPLPSAVTPTEFVFSDVDYHSGEVFDGTDWTPVVGSTGLGGPTLTWSTRTFAQDPNANALRFGTLYSFGFDADLPPGLGLVTLELFRVGVPSATTANAWVPMTSASFCDASDNALDTCPCTNPGAAETGCDIQQSTGGVGLSMVSRETSPLNRVTWSGTGFPAASTPTSIVIRATDLDTGSPTVFGDGLRCIGTPLVRLAATFAAAGGVTHTHGHGAGAGSGTFYYQLWFRNTPVMFCDPAAAFNLSNGRTLTW